MRGGERMNELYAHYDEKTGKKQRLIDHLENVANDAAQMANKIGQKDILFLIGLYHDLGKADHLFQEMMLKQTGKHVNHSSAGATYLSQRIAGILNEHEPKKEGKYKQSFIEVICYVITAHHGLYDIPIDLNECENNQMYKRLKYNLYDKEYSFQPDVVKFGGRLENEIVQKYYSSFGRLVIDSFHNFCQLWKKIESENLEENAFYLGLIVRLYLSFLKNADIKDTVNAYDIVLKSTEEEEYSRLIDKYVEKTEEKYASFTDSSSKLNQIRTEISQTILERSMKDETGIYRLNLPTGAGKTLLSMRYGFHQMKEKNKKRFIYIAPYLSILEQNALEIKTLVGYEGVLEHHSNVINPSDSEEHDGFSEITKNYLIDTWDSPIVLSTMVQFFQTLFKGKSDNIRRFSQLVDSVIILDEVQALPIEVTTLFNLTMNFLKLAMKTTVVLCTATQPVYSSENLRHRLLYGNSNGDNSELIHMTMKQREIFERTEISKLREDNSEVDIQAIFEDIEAHKEQSILVILNTKKAVSNLYELASSLPRSVFYLSTNMCAQHRLDIIKTIRERIGNEPLICISTQLIEAGVDLDFDYVIRSYAGIDSIVQAAGRCNREGTKPKGYVKLVNLAQSEESLIHLPAIKKKKEITEQIIKMKQSPIAIVELNDEFFERYYSNTKAEDFDYPTEKDGPTVFNYLSKNDKEFVVHKSILKQSFKTAAQKMNLIQDESQGALVYYDDGIGKQAIDALIEQIIEFEESYDIQILYDIKEKLKSLQPYTVNLRRGNAYEQAVTAYLDGSIRILQEDFYDAKVGIISVEFLME